MTRIREFSLLLRRAALAWHRDNARRLSAALAFYTVFSLAPLAVLLVLGAGLAMGREASQAWVLEKIVGIAGPQAASAVSDMLANAREPLPSLVAAGLGLATLLWGASTVFGSLADSLDAIWNVTRDGGRYGMRGFVRHRLLAFCMVAGTGAFLLASSLVTAGLEAAGSLVRGLLPLPIVLFRAVDFLCSTAASGALFAVVFKVVPSVRQEWRDVLPGAALTALLFAAGKAALGLYFVKSSIASAYGAAGSFAVLLLWIYFAAQIFYFGAEVNKATRSRRNPQ